MGGPGGFVINQEARLRMGEGDLAGGLKCLALRSPTQEYAAADLEAIGGQGVAAWVFERTAGAVKDAADSCADEADLARGVKSLSEEYGVADPDAIGIQGVAARVFEPSAGTLKVAADSGAEEADLARGVKSLIQEYAPADLEPVGRDGAGVCASQRYRGDPRAEKAHFIGNGTRKKYKGKRKAGEGEVEVAFDAGAHDAEALGVHESAGGSILAEPAKDRGADLPIVSPRFSLGGIVFFRVVGLEVGDLSRYGGRLDDFALGVGEVGKSGLRKFKQTFRLVAHRANPPKEACVIISKEDGRKKGEGGRR